MKHSRSLSLLAMASLAASTLSGCSPAAPATSEGPDKIRVSVANIQFETAYLAESEGFFAEHGLEVELVNGADPAAQIASAVSGEVDIATGSWINVATSVVQGVPVRALGANGLVDASKDNSGVMVAKDSDITSLAQLAGKVIGVVGVKTGSDLPLLQALEDSGVASEDIKEVAIPYAGMQAALEQGTVDAVLPSDTFFRQMRDSGFTSLGNPIRDYQGNQPGTVWVATEQWLTKNSDTTQKFLDAMEDAVKFYSEAENLETVRQTHARVNQLDPSLAPQAFVPASVSFNIEESQSGLDAMARFGLIETTANVDQILWEQAPRRGRAEQ